VTVRMINSVGEHVAGEQVDLPDDVADRYVLLGYAEGELSREYGDLEVAEIQGSHQAVSLGG